MLCVSPCATMICLTKPAFVTCDDLRQIQVLARQSDDELRQIVRRHIIDDRRRQELCLINCPRTKMSAHASKGIRFVPKMPPLLGHAPSCLAERGLRGCVVALATIASPVKKNDWAAINQASR